MELEKLEKFGTTTILRKTNYIFYLHQLYKRILVNMFKKENKKVVFIKDKTFENFSEKEVIDYINTFYN